MPSVLRAVEGHACLEWLARTYRGRGSGPCLETPQCPQRRLPAQQLRMPQRRRPAPTCMTCSTSLASGARSTKGEVRRPCGGQPEAACAHHSQQSWTWRKPRCRWQLHPGIQYSCRRCAYISLKRAQAKGLAQTDGTARRQPRRRCRTLHTCWTSSMGATSRSRPNQVENSEREVSSAATAGLGSPSTRSRNISTLPQTA